MNFLNGLKVEQLINLCTTNNQLCNDPIYWKPRLNLDYPNINDNNYQQIYIDLYQAKIGLIPIYYNDNHVSEIWINKYDTFKTILEKLKNSIIAELFKNNISLEFKQNNKILIIAPVRGILNSYIYPPDEKITFVYIYDTEQEHPDINNEQIDRPITGSDLLNFRSGISYQNI